MESKVIPSINHYAIGERRGEMKEMIICAAIQIVDTGKVYYGHRHHHCLAAFNDELSWTMNRQ